MQEPAARPATETPDSPLNKPIGAGRSKKRQMQGARNPEEGDVLRKYVDRRGMSATQQMVLFQRPAEPPPWAGSDDPLARRRYLHKLGEEIAEMAAHIESATWRLLRAIADYDRYEGWSDDFPSCAHTGLRIAANGT